MPEFPQPKAQYHPATATIWEEYHARPGVSLWGPAFGPACSTLYTGLSSPNPA